MPVYRIKTLPDGRAQVIHVVKPGRETPGRICKDFDEADSWIKKANETEGKMHRGYPVPKGNTAFSRDTGFVPGEMRRVIRRETKKIVPEQVLEEADSESLQGYHRDPKTGEMILDE